MEAEKQLTEKESLDLIAMMIRKAKDSYHDTGTAAIMWGAIIAICALEKLAEIIFNFRLPFDIYWITVLAVIPQVFISIREKKKRKVKSYDDDFMDYLWLGFGISIFLLIFITNVMFNLRLPENSDGSAITQEQWVAGFSTSIAPLFLLLYGIPTFVTGAACKFKPMLFGGLFCWLCSILTLYTPVKLDLILTAASAITAWLIPGIIMERDYRKAKKDLAASDV